METHLFRAGGEHFSAGDEHIENMRSNFSHTDTASYQQLPNKPYVEMIATHRCSPPKTGSFTLTYSHVYAIALSAGINSIQVD